AASFMNLSAVARALDGVTGLVIVCSGRENRFSLDDALCAGVLIQTLEEGREEELELNDAGRVVRDLASKYTVDVDFLRSTASGKALVQVGLEGDLDLCASLDRHPLVPEMRERKINIPPGQGQD
ncbi:MAG: 2-phosphosulfolactate phosphatase, partial [Gemmatimonadota bacterium]